VDHTSPQVFMTWRIVKPGNTVLLPSQITFKKLNCHKAECNNTTFSEGTLNIHFNSNMLLSLFTLTAYRTGVTVHHVKAKLFTFSVEYPVMYW
jgi:hypothetical protein